MWFTCGLVTPLYQSGLTDFTKVGEPISVKSGPYYNLRVGYMYDIFDCCHSRRTNFLMTRLDCNEADLVLTETDLVVVVATL